MNQENIENRKIESSKPEKLESEELRLVESDHTTDNSEKYTQNPHNLIEFEIDFIKSLLKNSKIEKLVEFIDSKLKQEKDSQPRNHSNALLLNIVYQIESLQLAQIAESIASVHCFQDKSKYLITLDETENLPKIEVNEVSYRLLLKYRDSSNFIISYDKNVNFQVLPTK